MPSAWVTRHAYDDFMLHYYKTHINIFCIKPSDPISLVHTGITNGLVNCEAELNRYHNSKSEQ